VRAFAPFVLLLGLWGCDPVGAILVKVVREGPGPLREPIAGAKVWLECPGHEGKAAEAWDDPGPDHRLTLIPSIPNDCVVVVEAPGFASKRYLVRDVCADPGKYACRDGQLYATLAKASEK
jgi:hypothetical protein